MGAIGIIAEYNPFHNGHYHQIRTAASMFPGSPVICIMSGNFVQRGAPALFNKYIRTEAALKCGAAVVVELPVAFATASAEYFANYGVALLSAMGIVDKLLFGSELGAVGQIEQVASILAEEPAEYQQKLKEGLSKGMSFPAARQRAMEGILPEAAGILSAPNNILGVEYIKSILRQNAPIKPYTIKRLGAGYSNENYRQKFPSATAIRKAIHENCFTAALDGIPESLREMYEKQIDLRQVVKSDDLSPYLQYRVKTIGPDALSKILDADEGLNHAVIKACEQNWEISAVLDDLKSKRYTYTKLSRLLHHIILDITKKDFEIYAGGLPHYIRILGFQKNHVHLFSQIKKSAIAPLIVNLKHAAGSLSPTGEKLLALEIRSTDIYNLALPGAFASGYEYTQPLVII